MEDDKMLLVTTAHVVEDRTILENLFWRNSHKFSDLLYYKGIDFQSFLSRRLGRRKFKYCICKLFVTFWAAAMECPVRETYVLLHLFSAKHGNIYEYMCTQLSLVFCLSRDIKISLPNWLLICLKMLVNFTSQKQRCRGWSFLTGFSYHKKKFWHFKNLEYQFFERQKLIFWIKLKFKKLV